MLCFLYCVSHLLLHIFFITFQKTYNETRRCRENKKNTICNNRFHEEGLNKLVWFCGRESNIII